MTGTVFFATAERRRFLSTAERRIVMMLRHWAADNFPLGLRRHGPGWATAEEISSNLWKYFNSNIVAGDVLKLVMESKQVWKKGFTVALEAYRFEVRTAETSTCDNPNDEVFIFCHPSKGKHGSRLRYADCHQAKVPWRRGRSRGGRQAEAEAEAEVAFWEPRVVAGDKAAGDKAASDEAPECKAAGDKAAGNEAASDETSGDKTEFWPEWSKTDVGAKADNAAEESDSWTPGFDADANAASWPVPEIAEEETWHEEAEKSRDKEEYWPPPPPQEFGSSGLHRRGTGS